MKAIKNTKNKIEFLDLPDPVIDHKFNVLVKVMSVGLCGSDVQRIDYIESQNEEINHPILGHEISGTIEKFFDDTKNDFRVGDRVTIEPIIYCKKCKQCLEGNYQFCKEIISLGKSVNGGFAEKVAVPLANIHKLPSNIDFDTGTLLDLCSVCVHISNLANGFKGKKIAIIGDGAVGLMIAKLAGLVEADVTIIGKRKTKSYNFINFKDEQTIKDLDSTFDLIIETVGRRNLTSINQAISLCRIKGQIIVGGVFAPNFELPIIARNLFYKEINLIGANSYSYNHLKQESETIEAMELLSRHYSDFSELITHQIPLKEFTKGLELFRNKDVSHALKIVFRPN